MKTWNVTWSCDDSGVMIRIKVYTMTGREERRDNIVSSAIQKARQLVNEDFILSLAISTPVITEESNASD